MVERENIDTHTHIYMTTYPPGIDTAIKSGGTKPDLWTQKKKKLIHKPKFNGKKFDVRILWFNQSAPNITSIYYRYFFYRIFREWNYIM